MKINRSTVYYKSVVDWMEKETSKRLTRSSDCFNENRKKYGTRKLKKELAKKKIIFSRRKIRDLMRELGIKSCYTRKSYKASRSKGCNEKKISNLLARAFDCWGENERHCQ